MIKDAQFRDNPDVPAGKVLSQLERLAYEQRYSSDQPEVHDIIRGFRRVLDSYTDRMMVGEVWPRELRSLRDYLRPDELQQAFNFRFLFSPWKASAFRSRIEEVEALLGAEAWPTYTLSNHDFPRHITRYGAANADARARVAAVLLLTMRGTPFIYYGEEIGMREVEIPPDRKRDPVGRDGCRTPMQWNAARNGGFTAASEAWLPIGDCNAVNVEKQLGDASSMLSLYRRMIHLRKTTPALSEGTYRTEAGAPDDCLIFHRETSTQHLIVALNFADTPRRIEVPRASILLSTIEREGLVSGSTIDLAPNEGVVLEDSGR